MCLVLTEKTFYKNKNQDAVYYVGEHYNYYKKYGSKDKRNSYINQRDSAVYTYDGMYNYNMKLSC